MTAKYWVARYVDDVFRNEPKNVGVIVTVGTDIAARFIGERDDGVLDGRKLAGFSHPSVYNQWRDYWRNQIAHGSIAEILSATTANYFVTSGGEVSDIGTDTAEDVCRFLFSALIASGGVSEAFKWSSEDLADQSLSAEIFDTLKQRDLLGDDGLIVRHPIRKDAQVTGRHVTHRPSLSQRNGKLFVMEYIDLSRPQQKHIRERSGYMAYMFSDIKEAEPTALTYSLVRPDGDGGDVIDYARSVLAGESQLVNWANPQERGAFLEERARVANSL